MLQEFVNSEGFSRGTVLAGIVQRSIAFTVSYICLKNTHTQHNQKELQHTYNLWGSIYIHCVVSCPAGVHIGIIHTYTSYGNVRECT